MNLVDIMSRNVIACNVSDSVSFVSNLMKKNDIGFIPVVYNKKVVGVVTDRDIVVKAISCGCFDKSISCFMSKNVISVSLDSSLSDVIGVFSNNRIKRVIVRDGNLVVGVLSISDLLGVDIQDSLYECIRRIWSISSNVHYNSISVRDFYL